MFRTSYAVKKIVSYMIPASLFGVAGAGMWYYEITGWLMYLSFALLLVAGVCLSGGLLEIWNYIIVLRNDRIEFERRMENYDPDTEYLNAEAKLLENGNSLARAVLKMTPKQMQTAVLMSPVFFEFMNLEESDRKYTRRQAEAVIRALTESEYGILYLPKVSDYPEGSTQYRVVKGVTDDLMLAGCAERNHKTARAKLIVSQDEAIAALFGEDRK